MYKKSNMLRAIYLATLKFNINVNVSRYLYYTLIRISIEDGYEFTSLGADPTLYGHMVSTGLFHIKRKMGFKPLPSKYMGEDSLDLYEKVLNIEKFNGLAMSLAYENNDLSSKKLDCYIFSSSRLTEGEKINFALVFLRMYSFRRKRIYMKKLLILDWSYNWRFYITNALEQLDCKVYLVLEENRRTPESVVDKLIIKDLYLEPLKHKREITSFIEEKGIDYIFTTEDELVELAATIAKEKGFITCPPEIVSLCMNKWEVRKN